MRRVSDERGAVLPIVVVVILVLVTSAALVTDVGALYWERRQLQNGADSGAWALALDCVSRNICFANSAKAADMAGRNAKDGFSDAAPTFTGDRKQGSVRVRTTTRQKNSSTIIPSRVYNLFGSKGSGTTVWASAAVAWGGPKSLTSQLPLTISMCEWNTYTAGGIKLAPSPPYPPWPNSALYPEEKIVFHTTDDTPDMPGDPDFCKIVPPGYDLPGGFGWLDEGCEPDLSTGEWAEDSAGVSIPLGCKDELQAMLGKIVHVPVFSQTNGLSGSNGEYKIEFFAAFYLTGYRFPGANQPSIAPGSQSCNVLGPIPKVVVGPISDNGNSDTCIMGYFTTDPDPTSGTIGGPSNGVTVMNMTE